MRNIVCPVSTKKIDGNVSRLTVFINVILLIVFLLTRSPYLIGLVAADYFIRAALDERYSPIRILAVRIIRILQITPKPIGQAQKIFASRLGFLCALFSTVLLLSHFTAAALIIAGLLTMLAALDAVLNYCVGCLIYNYVVYPFYQK
jgi:hypothetical protein